MQRLNGKHWDGHRLKGELDYAIITARARRYDAQGHGYSEWVDQAIGEEYGLRALARRLDLDVVDDTKTIISADATLLSWYVEAEEQMPQSVIDAVTKERLRLPEVYHVGPLVKEA